MYYCNYDPALLKRSIVLPKLTDSTMIVYNPREALCSVPYVVGCKEVNKKDICCRVDLDCFGILFIAEIATKNKKNILRLYEFIGVDEDTPSPADRTYKFREVGTIE